MRGHLLALALAGCTRGPVTYDDHLLVRVPVHDPSAVRWILDQPDLDLWTEHVVDHADVLVPADRLGDLPWPAEVLLSDVQAQIDRTLPAAPAAAPFDDWPPLDVIDDTLQQLADSRLYTELLDVGTSLEGRPIRALAVRPRPVLDVLDGVAEPTDKLAILVVGAQHAREWVAASSALWIADHLVRGWQIDPEVTALLDRYDVYVVPVANPDGYRFTWTTDRLWRKNRRDNGDGSVGVDLNRNWDAAFDAPGAVDVPSSDNWPGTAAFSEPETAGLAAFLRAHPAIGLHVDLHCTGQVALHPWGSTAAPPPDADALDAATADAAAAMAAVHGSPYRSGAFNTALYPAYGVAIDWSYASLGATSALFELRDRGQYGFLLPREQLVPTAEEAWAGLVALADRPERPHLALAVRDPLVPGTHARVRVDRVVAGAVVELYRSATGLGSTPLADGTTLALDGATFAARAPAGPGGAVTFRLPVPALAPGDTVWFQARSAAVTSAVATAEVP
ncbi:MAG: M14 family zinc carboxypeptidase [Myxococcota bacterium]